jgi:hypothetical protein
VVEHRCQREIPEHRVENADPHGCRSITLTVYGRTLARFQRNYLDTRAKVV